MLTAKSKARLNTCDFALQSVISHAHLICPIEFQITEGVRSLERQKFLFASRKSRTMNSRHLPNALGESEAVDIHVIIDGKANWEIENYRTVAQYVKLAASQLEIPVEWGGDFKGFFDGPHFQLKRGSK